MKMDPQFITAPGGERLVIITETEYRALLDARDDADDLAAAINGRASIAEDGAIPAGVVRAVRNGVHPIHAWRVHRDMTQAELAEKSGVTQAAIARIETAGPDAGRPATRKAIATALDAPLWSIGVAVGETPRSDQAPDELTELMEEFERDTKP